MIMYAKITCLHFLLFVGLFSCNESKKERTEELQKTFERVVEIQDYPTAIGVLNEMITLDSSNIDYYDTLAVLYLKTQMYQPAIVSAEKVTKKKESDKMMNILIECHQALGDFETVAGYYKAKIEKNPENIENYYNQGLSFFYAKQYENAVVSMEKVLAMPTASVSTVQIRVGNSIESAPYDAAALNVIGLTLVNLNDTASARKAFSEALKIAPNFKLVETNLQSLGQLSD